MILSEESERTQGEDAQSMNIRAARAVAEAVRTTLGPQGLDKMLLTDTGGVLVTNDGVTILDKMLVEHPAGNMLVEVAQSQEEEAGDGTTTAVILAGALLDEAEDLLDMGVHPQTIIAGYQQAAAHAREILDARAIEVSADDREVLEEIARTAMTGKLPAASEDTLVDLAIRAVQSVAQGGHDGQIDLDYLKTETFVGGTIADSTLLDGLIIDKNPIHGNMPTRVEDAHIALLQLDVDVKETDFDSMTTITDTDQLDQLLDSEKAQVRELVEMITDTGANVIFCRRGVGDLAQIFLSEAGVLTCRRVWVTDMDDLVRATGGRIISRLEDLSEDDLGHAGLVEQRTLAGEQRLFVEQCDDPRSLTIVIRGGTEQVVESAERAIQDAIDVVALTIEDARILPGGAAMETQLALDLRDYAASVGGREQLAIEAFADALERIPRTLAENAGRDPIDTLIDLRRHHDDGEFNAGLGVDANAVVDMMDANVVEPLRMKVQAITSAQEAANMILRIDDVIAGLEAEL